MNDTQKLEMIKSLPTHILLRICKRICDGGIINNDSFGSHALDDLYIDADFELAVRGIEPCEACT